MNTTIIVYMVCFVVLCTPLKLRAEEPDTPEKNDPVSAATVNASGVQCLLPVPQRAKNELGWEFDPYYSNLSLSIPLTDAPIPEVTGKNEFAIYRQLFQNAFYPRFILLEAAVFPMPLLGVGTKKYTPEFYRGFNVGTSDLNLMEAVTAGFQEPYAFSLFLGNMVSFVKPGEDKVCSNKGYMGYLFSYSNQHIKRNMLIPDHNLESEWKLKGDRVFKDEKLSWSFRVGAKTHENPDISNTVYLGFRRSDLDFSSAFLSFLDNSSIDFRWDFSMKDGRPLRQEYTIGKKIPIPRWHVAMRLDVGFIWEAPGNYSGRLRDTNYQSVVAVIRPNIEF